MRILPHVPYAEAVYANLAGADMRPSLIEVRSTEDLDLTMRLVWPPAHHGLSLPEWEGGLYLRWSSVTGWWAAKGPEGLDQLLLRFTAATPEPSAVTAAVFLLAEHGLAYESPGTDLREWPGARALGHAIVEWEAVARG